MGTVYRAVQASVERAVALKILRPDLTRDPDTAARFHREAHATSALKHPNTVTLYDFGQSPEGYLYIAMELLEGRLLGRMLKEDGALPVDLAVRIVTQASRSLAEAHRKGIVHRDLKPDNIMLAQVEGQEVVKVLDFGIAKVVRGDKRVDALETQAGTVFGTPRYMSPEQAQSKPLDARSDIYSLGVIFYQMLTGHAPFEDSDAVVVMARHIKTKPRRPSDVRGDIEISAALERLVMKMLEKDRNRRPQSSEELIEMLGEAYGELSEDEYSILGPRPPRRKPRVGPVAAAAGLIVLLAAGAVIAFAVTRGPDPEPELVDLGTLVPTPVVDAGPTKTAHPPPVERVRHEVFLDSEPAGAIVFRNGEKLGAVPMTVTEPEGEEINYEFVLEGRERTAKLLRVSESTRRVFVTLPELEPDSIRPGGGKRPRGGKRPPSGRDPTKVTTGPGPTKTPAKTPTKGGSPYSRWDGQ